VPATPRLKLHYPQGTDPADVPADNGLLANGIDKAAIYDQGALSGRPAPSLAGFIWLDPSTGLLYLDTGSAWVTINAVKVELAGTLKWTARTTPETGWLFCDGSAVSRTTYSDLFGAIGTTYGAGNGTTTFNLPDFRDRCPVGAGATWVPGQVPGAPNHAHVSPAHAHVVPDHAHGMPDHSHYTPDHLHGINIWTGGPRDASANFAQGSYGNAAGRNSPSPVNGSTGNADRSLQTSGRAEGGQNTFGSGAFWGGTSGPWWTDNQSSFQPSLVCNVMVKT